MAILYRKLPVFGFSVGLFFIFLRMQIDLTQPTVETIAVLFVVRLAPNASRTTYCLMGLCDKHKFISIQHE